MGNVKEEVANLFAEDRVLETPESRTWAVQMENFFVKILRV
jgi:hypothetical protein